MEPHLTAADNSRPDPRRPASCTPSRQPGSRNPTADSPTQRVRDFARHLPEQTPAHPAPVSGDSAPWQSLSGDLTPSSESDRGVEPDLSCPDSYLAATSFHEQGLTQDAGAQITENDSVPSQEESDVEQTAARPEEDVVNDEEAYDPSEPVEASTVEDEDPVEEGNTLNDF